MCLATMPCRSDFRNMIFCAPTACRCSFAREPKRVRAVRGSPEFLPIETNSIDLVLLPHVLEFSSNPHQILREVQRVLMPEGHVIVCGFNPRSLWGVRGLVGGRPSFHRGEQFSLAGQFHRAARLKDWLTLLDFEITEDRLCCYSPPFSQEKWLKRFHFMEAAGDRWWPFSGGYISSRRSNAFMECVLSSRRERRASRQTAPGAGSQKLPGRRR